MPIIWLLAMPTAPIHIIYNDEGECATPATPGQHTWAHDVHVGAVSIV